jgi:HD-GYP domain-containing protein (c-di-GMP phosphodiesterase class II)
MKDYLVREIPEDSYFSKTACLDQFVIAAPEMPFTKELADTLIKWDFRAIYSEGEQCKEYSNEEPKSAPSGDSVDFTVQSDADKIAIAEKFLISLYIFTENLFLKFRISNVLDAKSIAAQVKLIVDYIREDRRFLMRIMKKIEFYQEKNYLTSHSVRTTILSVVIGSYLKLPLHRLIELGIASMLHEIGMLKLPQEVYLSGRALTDLEKKAIMSHPILGYNILKHFNYPLAISLAALEHHERENGTGYPQQLAGEKISLYSKIIAVACSYDALSSKRPHKEAKDGYTGMLELLKNEGKQYNDTVVRALVLSLSIYPIGLYVLLSNGKKGQVVDVNPENPRFPIVQIFGELNIDGKIRTEQTTADGLSIVRPLNKFELDK